MKLPTTGSKNSCPGAPPIACKYDGSTTSGVCENEPFSFEPEEPFYDAALVAKPASGSEFVNWTVQKGIKAIRDCPQEENALECFLLQWRRRRRQSKSTAEFAAAAPAGPPLTLNIEEGSGTVVSNPAGIECTGSAPHECTTEEIAEGETVTLTASPAAGYQFKSWKYCDTGGVHGRQCTITLTETTNRSAPSSRRPTT